MTAQGRVLIVDDDENLLSQIESLLNEEGFSVTTNSSAYNCVRDVGDVDVVLVDYHMPGVNGAMVLKAMRNATSERPSKPLIYLYTSDTSVARRHEELGFDGAIMNKGDLAALSVQVRMAVRIQKLKSLTTRRAI